MGKGTVEGGTMGRGTGGGTGKGARDRRRRPGHSRRASAIQSPVNTSARKLW